MNASSALFGSIAFTITIADVVDAVIALTLVEAAALLLLHRWRGAAANRGLAPREIGLNLLSGLCLMAALYFAVRGSGAPWIAVCSRPGSRMAPICFAAGSVPRPASVRFALRAAPPRVA